MPLLRQQSLLARWLVDTDDETPPFRIAPSSQAQTSGALPRQGSDPSPHAPPSVASLALPSDVVAAQTSTTVVATQTTTVGAAQTGATATVAPSRKRGRHEDGSESRTPTRDGSVETDSSLSDGLVADNNWRVYTTRYTRSGWPTESGIINELKRYTDGRTPTEGRRLTWCLDVLGRLHHRGRRPVEHKVGLCYDAKVRWEWYTDVDDSTWRPDMMLLVDRPCNRAAAGFLEAGLIAVVFNTPAWRETSINHRRNDYGGSGPRNPQRANLPHYVYIAIRLL